MHHEPADRAAIERVVIDTLSAAASAKPDQVTPETELLQLVDSLGLIIALANIQAALNVSLDPQEIIQVFQCRSIAEVVLTLEGALSAQIAS